MRFIAPSWFDRIAAYEGQFGRTIQRHCSIRALADRGRPFPALLAQPDLAARAMQREWTEPVAIDPWNWRMPAGAFGDGAGPT